VKERGEVATHFHAHLATPLARIHDDGVDQRSQGLDRGRRHDRIVQRLL
jgi:hypothetical protein